MSDSNWIKNIRGDHRDRATTSGPPEIIQPAIKWDKVLGFIGGSFAVVAAAIAALIPIAVVAGIVAGGFALFKGGPYLLIWHNEQSGSGGTIEGYWTRNTCEQGALEIVSNSRGTVSADCYDSRPPREGR